MSSEVTGTPSDHSSSEFSVYLTVSGLSLVFSYLPNEVSGCSVPPAST